MYLPKGDLEKELLTFINEANEVLSNSIVNKKRKESNLPQANSIWPWSQGLMPKLPSFKHKYNKTGGIVTAVDLLKGLACLTGLESPNVEGATGFIDTNYQSKMNF